MSRNIDTRAASVKGTRHDFTNECRELRALLKTALEVTYDLENRGAVRENGGPLERRFARTIIETLAHFERGRNG